MPWWQGPTTHGPCGITGLTACNRYLLHFFIFLYVNKGKLQKWFNQRQMYLLNDFRCALYWRETPVTFVMPVRPSLHIYLIFRTLMRICWENWKLVKIGYFIRRRMYVLLLPTNYIVIRSLYSSEMVSGCSECRGGINIMRTPHCFTLHVHWLSCVNEFWYWRPQKNLCAYSNFILNSTIITCTLEEDIHFLECFPISLDICQNVRYFGQKKWNRHFIFNTHFPQVFRFLQSLNESVRTRQNCTFLNCFINIFVVK